MFSKISSILAASAVATTVTKPEQDLFLQESRPAAEPTQLGSNIFGNVPCQIIYAEAWYNLVDMEPGSDEPNYYQTPPNSDGVIAYWNFCQKLSVETTDPVCPDDQDVYAAYSQDEGATCVSASTDSQASIYTVNFTSLNLMVAGDNLTVPAIQYQTGDSLDDTCLLVALNCTSDADAMYTATEVDHMPNAEAWQCANYTIVTSHQMCSVYSIGAFLQLFDTYWWLFGAICIGSGFFLTLFGRTLLRAILFFVGLAATVFIVFVIFYSTFLKDNTEDWIMWVTLAGSALVGCLIGWLLTKLVRFGGAVLAGFGGFMAGMLINETWLYMYGLEWVFWVTCIALAVICLVIGFILFEPAIIVSTAFVGSYFVARGVGCFVRDASFPSIFVLIDQVQSEGVSQISTYFYIYLVGIVIFAIIGSFVQWKIWKKCEAKQKKKQKTYKGDYTKVGYN